MAFELNNCCFCIELRTGSLIIGYVNLIWNLIVSLLLILGMAAAGVLVSSKETQQTHDAHTLGTVALAVLGVGLVFVILNLIFIIVLLVGLHKYKRGHLKAYLIYAGIFIVFSIILFIVTIAQGAAAGDIVKNLINLLLSIYFFVVIRSYYLKMNDAAAKPAVYNTA